MLTLEPGSMCDVCMEEFGPTNLPHCIPCGHVLCLSCCDKILNITMSLSMPACPFCREPFFRGTVRLIRMDFNCVTSPAPVHHQRKKVYRSGGRGTSSSWTLGKAYFFTYSVLSAAGWALVLYRTLAHLSSGPSPSLLSFLGFFKKPSILPRVSVPSIIPAHFVPLYQRACTTYDVVGSTTAFVQSVAVLDVLHVHFGLVRSPMWTTSMRLINRLSTIWIYTAHFLEVQRSPFYTSMVLSWALNGVIRYTFYAASLVGWEFAPPLWARYSTIFVLYPIGASSEVLVSLAPPPMSAWFSILRGVVFLAWWPALYQCMRI